MNDPNSQSDRAAAGRAGATRTLIRVVGVVILMSGLSFAAVPFYNLFCRVTGFGGATVVGQGAAQILDQKITVYFDGSVHRGMPWRFEPAQKSITVRLGENATAYYVAHNPTDRVITGSASYNVTPLDLGGYFTKIDCFCFTEQTLQPGETVRMPVIFYVDPSLAEDPENHASKTITLSYTFFETEESAARAQGAGKASPARGAAAAPAAAATGTL